MPLSEAISVMKPVANIFQDYSTSFPLYQITFKLLYSVLDALEKFIYQMGKAIKTFYREIN
jgi:hypothetical protein